MRLGFLGAAGEVTGSCFLLQGAGARFLVDCGMVQGGREAAARNRKAFDFDPASIDFVLLTHAHIDHSGLLPKLVRDGFTGPIYATPATQELLGVMLPDSGHIHESSARREARRKGHQAAPPLYTVRDAERSLEQVRAVDYGIEFRPDPAVRVRFRNAGHILGSAIIEIHVQEVGRSLKLVFSGDLGQPGRPILQDPETVDSADIVVLESTYGNRDHPDPTAVEEDMIALVERTLNAGGGNVIMPAFAVGRTQQIIYLLHQLVRDGRLRRPMIFVDSPMATEVTHITRRHPELFDADALALVDWHGQASNRPWLHFTRSVEESKALNRVRSGAIIISASGMCEAGRVRHHLLHNLPRPECAVLLPGFQAWGTLGRRLVDGAQSVRLFSRDVPVRAAIHQVPGLSAHADRGALLAWASAFRTPPREAFIVHGEPPGAQTLAAELRRRLGWSVSVPKRGEIRQLAGVREVPA